MAIGGPLGPVVGTAVSGGMTGGTGPIGLSDLTLFPASPGRKLKSDPVGPAGFIGSAEFNDGADGARLIGGATGGMTGGSAGVTGGVASGWGSGSGAGVGGCTPPAGITFASVSGGFDTGSGRTGDDDRVQTGGASPGASALTLRLSPNQPPTAAPAATATAAARHHHRRVPVLMLGAPCPGVDDEAHPGLQVGFG
jgi:hypothetical protein